ncbi:MAG: EAL domain-containing protein, partial [Eubacteriales bacterium]
EDTSINLVIDKANIARRTIKGSYKNDFKIYNENLENINEREKQLEKRMGPALENGEFVPFLQPKFNLQTNTICGAEALARWKAKDRMIAPFEFIPAFERNGFITKLDFSIYDQVFRFMSKMLKEGRTLFPISLNVSRGHMSNPCFVEEVVALLKTYEIPHELVELEITESVFTEDKMLLKTFISEIRSYGMQVSIDDFGTAYSSLNLLKDVVVDVIKMDKSFIHDDVEDTEESIKSNKIIVKNIVNMIKELNFKIIFEGIETKEHVEFLSGIGCRYGQGYVFARPMPLEEFKSTYLQ